MPKTPITPRQIAESNVTQALLLLARAYRRMVDRQLADHHISEARALPILYIARAGAAMRQRELAEALGIEGPSLVRLLDQLGAAGLIERHPDPSDGRAKTLHMTPAGQTLAEEVEVILRAMRGAMLADVSDADLAATQRTLAALDSALKQALHPPAV